MRGGMWQEFSRPHFAHGDYMLIVDSGQFSQGKNVMVHRRRDAERGSGHRAEPSGGEEAPLDGIGHGCREATGAAPEAAAGGGAAAGIGAQACGGGSTGG